MKNLILCAAALLLSVCAFAAEPQEILSKIEKTNSTYTSLKGGFTQTKVLPTKARKNLKGDFYFSASDNLALIYTEPATDRVIISGGKLYLNRNAKASQYELAKSAAAMFHLMKVSPMEFAPVPLTTSVKCVILSKIHGTKSLVPSLISNYIKTV